MPTRLKVASAVCCLGLVSGCVAAPENETSTTLVTTSLGDDVDDDEADEAETDDSGSGSDASSSSTSSSDDADESDESDESTTTTTTTSTTTTEDDSTTDPDTVGDGQETADPAQCGWDPANLYYECGFAGTDPGGLPIDCPPGLAEGDPCANTGLTGEGCCDANGDNWYCAEGDVVFFNPCG